jgi:hypothetical protein
MAASPHGLPRRQEAATSRLTPMNMETTTTRTTKGTWRRVSRAEPCGICERPDWCVRGESGWNCMRVESAKTCRNGGWFHPFDAAQPPPPPLKNPMRQPKAKPPLDCADLMARWRRETAEERLAEIAASLGVSARALQWLGAAWAWKRDAVAFPMFDGTSDEPCGIRLRTMRGEKFAVTGSKSGVFFPLYCRPLAIPTDRIFVCEGPTDTAACLDLGVFAIGRASCRGQEGIVLEVLRQLGATQCVVVCDNDGPGIEGAEALLRQIRISKIKFVPPGKDMRRFVADGGTLPVLNAMLAGLLARRGATPQETKMKRERERERA